MQIKEIFSEFLTSKFLSEKKKITHMAALINSEAILSVLRNFPKMLKFVQIKEILITGTIPATKKIKTKGEFLKRKIEKTSTKLRYISISLKGAGPKTSVKF